MSVVNRLKDIARRSTLARAAWSRARNTKLTKILRGFLQKFRRETSRTRKVLLALERMPPTEFVMSAYEVILSRGGKAREIASWITKIDSGRIRRAEIAAALFQRALFEAQLRRSLITSKDRGYLIPGTGISLSRNTWRQRRASRRGWNSNRPTHTHAKFPIRRAKGVKVSVITSFFKGKKYIEAFLANITSQTIFDKCELIIVDANSPQGEHEVIGQYAAQFPQIIYLRLPYSAPIYTAWNLAIKQARGRYLTNANVDDLRRMDSLEVQAATLDNLPFVDVVYQDVIYSFEYLPYEEASVLGVTTRLPLATPHTMMEFNCPHNAPMWRRRLHSDIGLFDDTMRSAADWDFWIRALIADKTFYKLNDPNVVYYVNPDGVSTGADMTASEEEMKVSKRLFRSMVPRASIESLTDFRKRCGAVSGIDDVGGLLRYREVQSLMRRTAEQWESFKPFER